jgi:hypothetical protein
MEVNVERGQTLKSGDQFKIRFKMDQDAFLYILLQGTTGNITQLFGGKIDRGKTYTLPEGNDWFRLDENSGQETIFLLPARTPLKQLDGIIQDLQRMDINKLKLLFPESSTLFFEFKHE